MTSDWFWPDCGDHSNGIVARLDSISYLIATLCVGRATTAHLGGYHVLHNTILGKIGTKGAPQLYMVSSISGVGALMFVWLGFYVAFLSYSEQATTIYCFSQAIKNQRDVVGGEGRESEGEGRFIYVCINR